MYGQQAREPNCNISSEYQTIAMQFRKTFYTTSKKPPAITRGNAFNADFGGEEASDNIPEETLKGKAGRPGGRKRMGITLINQEASSKQSKNRTCTTCNFKKHLLPDCWTTFEYKQPDGFTPTPILVQRVKEKLAKDKDLSQIPYFLPPPAFHHPAPTEIQLDIAIELYQFNS
jgi:hypothetical protein